jgi:hypothetical protein
MKSEKRMATLLTVTWTRLRATCRPTCGQDRSCPPQVGEVLWLELFEQLMTPLMQAIPRPPRLFQFLAIEICNA